MISPSPAARRFSRRSTLPPPCANRDAATAAWRFLIENLYDAVDRKLYRRWRDGERAIDAFLDDYAALVQAAVDLYEMSFDASYLGSPARSPTPCWSASKTPRRVVFGG